VLLIDAGWRLPEAYKLCAYAGRAFDIIPPGGLTADKIKSYRTVVVPPSAQLDGETKKHLGAGAKLFGGTKTIWLGEQVTVGELARSVVSRAEPLVETKSGVVNQTVLDSSGRRLTVTVHGGRGNKDGAGRLVR
jgi:hypothetical protein